MNPRTTQWLAWTLALAAILLSAISAPFVYLTRGAGYIYWAANIGAALPSSIVGALILSRRPRHTIGGVFCAIGIVGGLDAFAGAYGGYASTAPVQMPAGIWFVWLSGWFWLPLVLLYVLLLFAFPTGRPISPRWNWGVRAAILGNVLGSLGAALFPAPLMLGGVWTANPVGLAGAEGFLSTVVGIGFIVYYGSMAAAAASLILRLRRARGTERQQLKWFAYAGVLALILAFPSSLPFSPVNGLASAVASLLVPVAAGIAILRYHLYDIDLLIRRTLIYSSLTAILVLAYLSSVVVLQQLFYALTRQQSDAAIIVSTLAIAALFNPLRGRVQTTIDRHFYRRRYDAAKVLAAFGATTRDEVDLNRLTDELLAVVEETMQPAHSSLWLRESSPERRS